MNQIEAYLERILTDSTPQCPLWNVEKIRQGKACGWNYIDGCMMIALLNLHRITGQQRYFDFVHRFLDYYVGEDGSLLDFREEEYNLDNICEGRVLFDLYAATGEKKYRRAIDTLRQQLRHQPRTEEGSFWHKAIYPHQVWLDGLYMAQVFYTRCTTELEDCAGYEDIHRQFLTVRRHMYDLETGLYRHGYDASGRAFWAGDDGCSANPWLRSLGWFAAALVDVTELIAPGHDAFRDDMVSIARELADGLRRRIDPDSGMLWQVPHRIGQPGNYPETSGSAMVAYFFLKGARLGILEGSCAKIGRDIFDGICRRYLTGDNGTLNLGGICLVAGLGPENNRRRDGSYDYYISEPVVENDAKGLAPFLLTYTELLQSQEELL